MRSPAQAPDSYQQRRPVNVAMQKALFDQTFHPIGR